MVGYQNDGYALFAAQLRHGVNNLAPTLGVEHSGRLVEHYNLRLHGDNARYRNTLLLTAGQKMRCMKSEFVHIDRLERIVHSLAYLRRGHTEIFRCKGNIILNNIRNYLIVRVLEHHSYRTAYSQKIILVASVDAVYFNASLRGEQYGIEVLCEGRFSRAVMTEYRDEAAALNFKAHTLKAFKLITRIGVMQIFYFYN